MSNSCLLHSELLSQLPAEGPAQAAVSGLVSLLLNYREIRAHRKSIQSDRLAWVSSRSPTAGTQTGSQCSQLRQWQAVHLAAYLPVPFCHDPSSETTLREAVSPTVPTTREYIFLQPH